MANGHVDQQDKLTGQPVCGRCVGSAIEKALNDRSLWEDRPTIKVTPTDELVLPPALLAMKGEMHPETWQEVLKQRALKLVEEEMAERLAVAAEVEKKAGAGAGQHVADVLQHLPKPYEPLQVYRQAKAESPVEAKAEPVSPVSAEIQQQHVQLDELGETLERLEDRLRPVLEGAATGWEEKAQLSPRGQSPLVVEIQEVSARMVALQERLRQVLARLVL